MGSVDGTDLFGCILMGLSNKLKFFKHYSAIKYSKSNNNYVMWNVTQEPE